MDVSGYRGSLARNTFINIVTSQQKRIDSEIKRISNITKFEYELLKELKKEAASIIRRVSKEIVPKYKEELEIKRRDFIKNIHIDYTEKLYKDMAEFVKKKYGQDTNVFFPKDNLKME
jgi:hypothetical protein